MRKMKKVALFEGLRHLFTRYNLYLTQNVNVECVKISDGIVQLQGLPGARQERPGENEGILHAQVQVEAVRSERRERG